MMKQGWLCLLTGRSQWTKTNTDSLIVGLGVLMRGFFFWTGMVDNLSPCLQSPTDLGLERPWREFSE